MTTVLIYVDTSKKVGDAEHLKVFADQDAAEAWFAAHDPEGVAFAYAVRPSATHPANDNAAFLLSSEAIAQNAEPLIGELTLTTDQGDIVLAINKDGADELAGQLASFLDTEG